MSIKGKQTILNDATPIDFQHLITACGRVLLPIALVLEFPCFSLLFCLLRIPFHHFLHSRHNRIFNRISGIKLRLGVLLPDHAQFSGEKKTSGEKPLAITCYHEKEVYFPTTPTTLHTFIPAIVFSMRITF